MQKELDQAKKDLEAAKTAAPASASGDTTSTPTVTADVLPSAEKAELEKKIQELQTEREAQDSVSS